MVSSQFFTESRCLYVSMCLCVYASLHATLIMMSLVLCVKKSGKFKIGIDRLGFALASPRLAPKHWQMIIPPRL